MPTQSMSAERIIECYGGPVRRLMDAVPQQPIAPNMKAGSVTDDTEQAFVLAARLIEDHGRIDNDAYAQDLLRWEAKMKEKGIAGPARPIHPRPALQALAEGSTRSLPDDSAPRTERHARHPGRHRLHSRKRLAEEAWRSCVVTHNTMQGIESTTLVAAAVSLAIAGERGFLSKALAFVESQPPRGNWSAKASVVARVKMFMEWAVREDGSMSDGEFATILRRDCGTSVEANESVAAAFAIATRFFDKPTEALCFAASLGGTPTPSPRSPARCSAHGMVRTASTRICADRCCASSKTTIARPGPDGGGPVRPERTGGVKHGKRNGHFLGPGDRGPDHERRKNPPAGPGRIRRRSGHPCRGELQHAARRTPDGRRRPARRHPRHRPLADTIRRSSRAKAYGMSVPPTKASTPDSAWR